jgi:hypothetical protein
MIALRTCFENCTHSQTSYQATVQTPQQRQALQNSLEISLKKFKFPLTKFALTSTNLGKIYINIEIIYFF